MQSGIKLPVIMISNMPIEIREGPGSGEGGTIKFKYDPIIAPFKTLLWLPIATGIKTETSLWPGAVAHTCNSSNLGR